MIKAHLTSILAGWFQENGVPLEQPLSLESPKQADMGDYALTCCFSLAKPLRKAPKLIAEDFVAQLNSAPTFTEKLTFEARNGFINIRLSDAYLWEVAIETFKTGYAFPAKNESVLLEYVSANPTGPLHIGHGRWAVLGMALANLLRTIGVTVSTEFYINDAGNQVDKFRQSVAAAQKGLPIPEDGYHGAYIQELAQDPSDPLPRMLALQRSVLKKINITFDTWFSEKSLYTDHAVESALNALEEKNVTYKEDDALWFRSTDFGDDKDRVLIKADGHYTYFAVDIAYHKHKLDRGFNKLINIWGADHHGYVPRVKAAVQALGYSKEKLDVLIGQLVSLKRGGEPVRMSKRTGEMITFEEVIDEIGADATIFYLLYRSADSHVEFDLEVAKSQTNENPVYYVQYAHARICSILRKLDLPLETPDLTLQTSALTSQERELLLLLVKAKETVYESALSYAPYRLMTYVYDIAKLFHHVYETCPIATAEPIEKAQRVALVYLTKKVLKETLALVGISAPASM